MNKNLKTDGEGERNCWHSHTLLFSSVWKCHLSLSKRFKWQSLNCTSKKYEKIWFDLFLSALLSIFFLFIVMTALFSVSTKVFYFFLEKTSFQAKNIVLNSIFFSFLSILAHTHHITLNCCSFIFCVSRRTFSIFDTSFSIEMSRIFFYCRIINGTRDSLFCLLAIYSRHRSHF